MLGGVLGDSHLNHHVQKISVEFRLNLLLNHLRERRLSLGELEVRWRSKPLEVDGLIVGDLKVNLKLLWNPVIKNKPLENNSQGLWII